jgi:hypothetical protein
VIVQGGNADKDVHFPRSGDLPQEIVRKKGFVRHGHIIED